MKKIETYDLFIQLINGVLIMLWVYTALSKLSDFHLFQKQMRAQVFGPSISNLLVFAVPAAELFTAALLYFQGSRKFGFLLSTLILLLFTIYIALILLDVFPERPCSCGGVLQSMGWHSHLWFNLAFLLLSFLGSWLSFKRKEVSE